MVHLSSLTIRVEQQKIETTRNPMPNIVEFHEGFNTIVDYVFMVGTEKSEIETAEVSII